MRSNQIISKALKLLYKNYLHFWLLFYLQFFPIYNSFYLQISQLILFTIMYNFAVHKSGRFSLNKTLD